MSTVRIATRGSDLALAQANNMAERIRNELDRPAELVVIRTTGDRIQDQSLAKIGGKGLFVKEIEEALLDGRADVAVHSAKDLPATIAPGCSLAAFPERADPRDALVARGEASLEALPQGARIGTGSTRRSAQLRAWRSDLEIVPLRGNVPTRIGKLESEGLDAVILACAGLDRLSLGDKICERISSDLMLPAVCQGTLALETRADDSLHGEIARLEDATAALTATAERAFLLRIGGDCTTPMAAFAELSEDGKLSLRALLSSEDGKTIASASGADDDPAALGLEIAERVLADGGEEILAALSGS